MIPSGHGPSMVFIVGRGRSGTTLLSSLLDAHPLICVAPESLFIMYLYRRYRRRPWDSARVRAFARDLWLESRMGPWGLDRDEVERALLARGAPAGFGGLCGEVFACYARGRGRGDATVLGDKNPGYSLFVSELREVFPSARFIHVVRDPRDNVHSFSRVPFDADDTATLAYRWNYYNTAILAASRRSPPSFLRLRYEDLVRNPEAEMERLCRFLDVQFVPEMLVRRAPKPAPSWHPYGSVPVSDNLAGRWQREMSSEAVRLVDWICSPVARELGYDVERPELGTRLLARLGRGALVAGALVRLERLVFRLPPRAVSRIIDAYRARTASLDEDPAIAA